MSDALDPASETIDEGLHCRHCGRHLVYWQATYFHASAWDAAGQREIYRHCRVHVADPAGEGRQADDEIEREASLTAYFRGGDTDWENPDVITEAGFLAFRAGWRAARS